MEKGRLLTTPKPLTVLKVKVKSLSHVPVFASPWTVAHQAPQSMGFSRQEYWSGVPLPSPKYLDVLERNDKYSVYELVRVCETVKEIPKGIKMKKIYPYNCLGK